ncbi:MAG: O-antigen ligase family protein, partial [Candidatus Marsarchaeota archaeon]|nr:O-antigen ligase family protein [Candidatus Marsarchaeota archaeon]
MNAILRSPIQAQRVTSANLLLIGLALTTILVGMLAAVAPLWVITFSIGIPAVVPAVLPRTRYWALLMIFALAPIMPFVKAFTNVRYGPLALDGGLAIIALGLFGDQMVLRRRIKLSWAEITVLLFMSLGIIQAFNPLGPGIADAMEGYRMLVWQAVGYLLGRRLLQTRDQVRILVLVLRVVAVIVAIYGIKQYFFPSELDYRIILSTSGDPSTFTSLGQGRAFSTMSSAAHLSYFMVGMLLLNVSLFRLSRHKSWLMMQMGIMSLALLLTIVRTGWVGLLAGLVVMGILRAAERRSLTRALSLLALALMAYVLIGHVLNTYLPDFAITQRFDSLTNLTAEKHYQMRVDSWSETILPAIAANPLGYGTGSDTTASTARFYSHNGYFYVAIELGIPGLLLLSLILAGSLG